MSSQVLSSILSGPFFGDLTPSDSSPTLHVGKKTPTSSPLILDQPFDDMEKLNASSDSNNGLNKIGGCGPDASQDDAYLDQVVQARLDALPSICQRNLPCFNPKLLTGRNSFSKPNLSAAEGSLYLNQQNLASCEQKTVPGPSRLRDGETEADYRPSRVGPSIPAAAKEYISNPLHYEHLTISSSPLDPDLSQTPSPEVAHAGFSHRIDFESCEGFPSLLPESFKSTAGHSDDILPRPIFNGEKEYQETDMNINFSINPENLPDAAYPPMIYGLEISDPDATITDISLTSTEQKDQSHERTGIRCLSHHSDIPSSSPIVHTEYSQSDPYFTPATIFRAHSQDIRTDVVGIQELDSSSPPSSPSMTSNYLPTSSPVPNSSPMDGPTQTPPASSPITPGGYLHNLSEGIQEGFYTDENYTSFPHYAMDHRAYQPLHRHGSNDFFVPDPRQHSSTMSESLMPPPFIQGYFDVAQEIPKNIESYPPTELNLAAAEPLSPVPGPSSQKIEPPAQTTSQGQQTQKATPKNVVPNPKRPTLAGVRQQQKKLSKPFRSPIIHPPVRLAPKPPTKSSEPLVSSANSAYLKEAAEASKNSNVAASSSSQAPDTKMKHRTTRAAAQFKSPLSSSSTSSDEAALVRLTPTIQSLERKLQLLRRALKVREDVQEEVLEGLVNKWSEAGKEVAWEVWDVVKDNANTVEGSGSDDKKGKKRAVEENWGWDESTDSKKQKTEVEGERNWGWDVVPIAERGEDESHAEGERESQQEDESTEETPQPSLGTMLLQLGIAPETFGWSEEEGGFVDK